MSPFKILGVLMLAGFLPLAAACGTIAGFGQDVERTGEALQDEAED